MKNLFTISLSLIFCFYSLKSWSQQISGPITCNVNETCSYTTSFPSGFSNCEIASWHIQANNAGYTNSNGAECSVTWTSPGTFILEVVMVCPDYFGQQYSAQISVTVNGTPEVAPPTPTIVEACGNSATLRRSIPPSGVTYYWQTSEFGTSIGDDDEYYSVSTDGYVYLRAKNSFGWGPASSVYVDIKNFPEADAGPDISKCLSGTSFDLGGTPSGGTWKLTSNSEELSNGVFNPASYNAGTYEVEYFVENSAECFSSDTKIITLLAPPQPPENSFSVSGNTCGIKVLTRNTPPNGISWHWQGTNSGGKNNNSSQTYDVNSSGTYYLRAQDAQGCWSTYSRGKSIAYKYRPDPPTVNSTLVCSESNNLILEANSFEGQNYIWYDENNSLLIEGNPYVTTLASDKTFQASVVHDNGCESDKKSINVEYAAIPQIFSVVGGGGHCPLNSGVPIGLNDSEPGIEYNLLLATNEIASQTGTGSAISFGIFPVGTYYVEAVNELCQDGINMDGSATVFIYDLPAVNAGSNNTLFINNNALTLAGTPSGGTWSGSGVNLNTFYPENSGVGEHELTYTIIGSTNGCTNSDIKIISVLARPQIISDGSNGNEAGEKVQLSTGIYDSYQWIHNNTNIPGANNATLSTGLSGAYKVRVTKNGATSTSLAFNIEILNDENFIKKKIFLVEANESEIQNLSDEEIQVSYTYFDGLGREMQTVAWQASPDQFDIVTPVQYDPYGRQPFAYLPYVSSDNDGWYKPNAINDGLRQNSSGGATQTDNYLSSEQYDFYNSTATVATDPFPYSETIFEPSPLNRVLEQGAPGQTWQPTNGNSENNKTIKYNYRTNGANEVVLWTYDYPDGTTTNEFGTVTHSFYSFENNEGQLFVTETTDEHGNLVIEYKDKQDQVILKKVQAVPEKIENNISNINPASHDHFACTYYVYDDFGNLRFVFPPQMVEEIKGGWSVTTNTLNRWAFQYDYDGRQRMIKKKVPGAEPVYMVYDERDRLVLTQDGVFRKDNKWLFTKYDHLNRPIMTGEYTHSSAEEPEAMQEAIITFIGGTASNYYEDRKSDGTHGYTNRSFPKTGITNYLTVTYYDDYLFTTYSGNGFDGVGFEPNTIINYDDQDGTNDGYFSRVKGQVTGSKTKVLGENKWLVSTSYYDDRYRPIQTVSQNILEGVDRVSMEYDFVGKVLREEHLQTTLTAGTVKINKRYEYDHAGRLLKLYHQINDSGPEILMAENHYNALGELIEKNIHVNETTGTMAQSTDYRYNIRGWLESINNSSLLDAAINPDAGQPIDVFGMELMYDQQK